ncbi:MAG TPA: GNAT family protein [Planctomycetota bacterium]|jgi:ribosomal-protein-alanine N-acetyltransferase|nr:GNAT family protein [Planctomycetota bacterium]
MKRENRILLRTPTTADSAEFLDFVRQSRRLHRSWVAPPSTRKAFLAYVGRCRRDDFTGLLARRIEDDAIVGVFNLSQIFRGGFQNAYLGYYGSSRYRGRGYMTEGMALLLGYAFRTLRLHRLEANVQPRNAASIALVRRCGFRKEGFSPRYLKVAGRWRDHERWAITAEDWRERLTSRRQVGE